LSRSATITQQHDDFASFHSLEWPHRAPPTAANQGDLLPKCYVGVKKTSWAFWWSIAHNQMSAGSWAMSV